LIEHNLHITAARSHAPREAAATIRITLGGLLKMRRRVRRASINTVIAERLRQFAGEALDLRSG
jgi:hypothetical protein